LLKLLGIAYGCIRYSVLGIKYKVVGFEEIKKALALGKGFDVNQN
jgi:hypothetical protein